MKISSSIIINKPAEEVWNFMNDTSRMKEWQQGYTSTKQLSGNPAEEGSKATHTYTERGKPFEMTETVLNSHPPQAIDIILEHPTMDYAIETRLIPQNNNSTLINMESQVTFKAFSFKLLRPLLKGPFQKRQNDDLKRLKDVMENNG